MAIAAPGEFSLDRVQRRAILERLLADHPTSAVGVVDPALDIEGVGPVLAGLGLAAGSHPSLMAGALAEFLAVSDVGLIGDASKEVNVRGAAVRTVHLRDGQVADLHLIAISDTAATAIAVIVPGRNAVVTVAPPASALPSSPRVGLVVCDAYGVIIDASDSVLVLLGRPSAGFAGRSIVDLVDPEDQEMAIVNWLAAKEQRGVALRWRCRLICADGAVLWTEVTIKNQIGPDGAGHVELEVYDISIEVAATAALIAERETIELLTETLPVGVAKFDLDGHVEHANGRLRELLAPADPNLLIEVAVRGELQDRSLAAAFATLLREGASSRLVVDQPDGAGSVRQLEWTIRAAFDHAGAVTGGVICVADVTEATRLRQALELRATTDALTGCLNRAGTIEALEHAMAHLDGAGIGLLFIDLDDFKGINDSFGHAVGDAVLEVVAGRLRSGSRPGDLIGRLGGDEFVIISPGLVSTQAAEMFAERISRRLQGTAMIFGSPVPIAASIGSAWTSSGAASELIGAADAAMYIIKRRGPFAAAGAAAGELAAG